MLRPLILVLTAAMIPLSFVHAPYPKELILQHIPTVVGISLLAGLMRTIKLSRVSFASAVAFLWLHIIGARWIYSYVPYDAVVETLTGRSLSARFGWQRNHYDRLVHAAFGILGLPLTSELLQRFAGMRRVVAAVMAMSCILAMSAIYEILEWQIAVRLSPDQAEAYNGQQGDIWDPQKDMALAGLGALVSALVVCRWNPISADLGESGDSTERRSQSAESG